MHPTLKHAFESEMAAARQHYEAGAFDRAFRSFERAHILGQRNTLPHVRSPVWMLRVGLRRRDLREIFGQTTRIAAAALFSQLWVPEGNTGGADVSPLRPMPVPADLRAILDAAR